MTWELPPPSALGLPAKFSSWRPFQVEGVLRATEAGSPQHPELEEEISRRFQVFNMPTGSGKSLVYTATATLRPGRTCILTSTKGLQRQLDQDFGGSRQ